jgi:hypothetical protein
MGWQITENVFGDSAVAGEALEMAEKVVQFLSYP